VLPTPVTTTTPPSRRMTGTPPIATSRPEAFGGSGAQHSNGCSTRCWTCCPPHPAKRGVIQSAREKEVRIHVDRMRSMRASGDPRPAHEGRGGRGQTSRSILEQVFESDTARYRSVR
jgi:hypothetical protein